MSTTDREVLWDLRRLCERFNIPPGPTNSRG
jgi:hypothetical protein